MQHRSTIFGRNIGGQPNNESNRHKIMTSTNNTSFFADPGKSITKRATQPNRGGDIKGTITSGRVLEPITSDFKVQRSSSSTSDDKYGGSSSSYSSTTSSRQSDVARQKTAACRRSSSNTVNDGKPKIISEYSTNKSLCCDKCDGKHETANCPYYKKSRDDHPDAQKNAYKKMGGTSKLPHSFVMTASVKRQPGDGSCLFHSMSYGLKDGSNASTLRAEICSFIASNPNTKICDTPLSDWVKWDSNSNCSEYARKMSRGSWGGGIEMACVSIIKKCNVHVYERTMMGYKRISAFDYHIEPSTKNCVRVLYQGGVHYDSLVF